MFSCGFQITGTLEENVTSFLGTFPNQRQHFHENCLFQHSSESKSESKLTPSGRYRCELKQLPPPPPFVALSRLWLLVKRLRREGRPGSVAGARQFADGYVGGNRLLIISSSTKRETWEKTVGKRGEYLEKIFKFFIHIGMLFSPRCGRGCYQGVDYLEDCVFRRKFLLNGALYF